MNELIYAKRRSKYGKKILPFLFVLLHSIKVTSHESLFPWLSVWHYYLYLCLNHLSVRVVFIPLLSEIIIYLFFSIIVTITTNISIHKYCTIAIFLFWVSISIDMEWRGNVSNYYVCIYISIEVNKIFGALQICIVFICRSSMANVGYLDSVSCVYKLYMHYIQKTPFPGIG